MYIILLNKQRFDQISCSGRSGTRWQYEVSKRYEIVKRLGIPALYQTAGWTPRVSLGIQLEQKKSIAHFSKMSS